MRPYEIACVDEPIPLSGAIAETAWESAAVAPIDSFTWKEGGSRPKTTTRMLRDEEALYLQFQVEDDDISAEVTDLNGPTFRYSSVEFFAGPTLERDGKYFNSSRTAVERSNWRGRTPAGASGMTDRSGVPDQ